jgi:hypothetical protein
MKPLKTLSLSALLFLSPFTMADMPAEEPLDVEFVEFFSMLYESQLDETRAQLDHLAQKLRIQPEQQTAWDNFAQMVIDNKQRKQQHQLEMREKIHGRMHSMHATELLQVHLDNLRFQQQEVENTLLALQPLYSVLLPDQKLAMDKLLKRLWHEEKMKRAP